MQTTEHLKIPLPSHMYSRPTLMRLLNAQQLFLLETVDGIRNVRELALLHGSTDELIMQELEQLATLEIIHWHNQCGNGSPSTEESIASTNRSINSNPSTPLPLRHVHHTDTHALPTVSSITPLPLAKRDTKTDYPHIHGQNEPTKLPMLPSFLGDLDMDTESFIKSPSQKVMDWEDVCIPESPTPVRPQHTLPPPSNHTPLPIYRPTPPPIKKRGPFTPNTSNRGFKPTIKKD